MISASLPFYPDDVDVIICGSTFLAVEAAVASARRGKRAVLLMERTNPCPEFVGSLRSWIPEKEAAKPNHPLFETLLQHPHACTHSGDKRYFNPAILIDLIEDYLDSHGVRYFYNMPPALLLTEKEHCVGVICGGKTGLFGVQGKVVIDATLQGTLGKIAIRQDPFDRKPSELHLAIELKSPTPHRSATWSDDTFSIEGKIHHRFASFRLQPLPGVPPAHRHKWLARASHSLLNMRWSPGETRFRLADVALWKESNWQNTTAEGMVPTCPGLFILGPGTDGGALFQDLLNADLKAMLRRSEPILNAALDWKTTVMSGESQLTALHAMPEVRRMESVDFHHGLNDPGFEEIGERRRQVSFAMPAPSFSKKLLICGAGTSGIAASIEAARLGLSSFTIDRGLEVGGTQTLGGVTNLWYGSKTHGFERYYRRIGAANDSLNAKPFQQALVELGGVFLPAYAITGAIRKERRVSAVYVIGDCGLEVIEAEYLLDATGDGSLAAWVGNPYTFGGEIDEITLWGSFAYFESGRPEASRPFLSPVDERSPWDSVRFIKAMRRERKVSPESNHTPPPFYLAPRESRHITCRERVTYLDVLAGRKFANSILSATSNLDIKGIATSTLARAGFIPTNWLEEFCVSIPYGALNPVTLDNMLVIGKAYDIEHDAFAMARMQRDLFAMGVAAAHASDLAIHGSSNFFEISISNLQDRLIELELLKPEAISSDDIDDEETPPSLAKAIASKTNLNESLAPSARLLLRGKKVCREALLAHAGDRTPAVTRLLAFTGEPRALEDMTSELSVILTRPEGFPTQLFCPTPHIMPDQGSAPYPALLLGLLTAGDAPSLGQISEGMLSRLEPMDLPFDARWGYLYAISHAVLSRPGAYATAHLEHILAAPCFKGPLVARSECSLLSSDPLNERHATLKLYLAKALIACDRQRGEAALMPFLTEWHSAWARSAAAALGRPLKP